MRVFLCSFAGFSVAIPMNSVASLIVYKSAAEQAVKNNLENNNTYISLPLLFENPQAVIRHGLVLKNENNEAYDHEEFSNKTILLTTEVECEREIPQEIIFPVPKIFSVLDFSLLFNGISFYSQEATLFLNTKEFFNNIETKLGSIRRAA